MQPLGTRGTLRAMRRCGLVLDAVFKRHDTGPHHPENPARLDWVERGLARAGLLEVCERITPTPLPVEMAQPVHAAGYLTRVEAACRQNYPYIDVPDSAICPESWDIALLAAGSVCDAAQRVADGRLQSAFCAVRPPGHHAEADHSMGFCLLNNIAIAAWRLKSLGFSRILIVDFDVHHGNGTQHRFDADPGVLFISLHGHPRYLYPGTGAEEEVGVGAGHGYSMNIPFKPGATDAEYHAAFRDRVIPAAARYAPQIVLVSAGFDAHADDPLGNLDLSDEAFPWMTRELRKLADAHADGRMVSVLEGGYNQGVLERCVPLHVAALSADA